MVEAACTLHNIHRFAQHPQGLVLGGLLAPNPQAKSNTIMRTKVKHRGQFIELHFMVLSYLLQGPPRTYDDIRTQFASHNKDLPRLWCAQAVRLGLVLRTDEKREGYRLPLAVFTPVKTLQ